MLGLFSFLFSLLGNFVEMENADDLLQNLKMMSKARDGSSRLGGDGNKEMCLSFLNLWAFQEAILNVVSKGCEPHLPRSSRSLCLGEAGSTGSLERLTGSFTISCRQDAQEARGGLCFVISFSSKFTI